MYVVSRIGRLKVRVEKAPIFDDKGRMVHEGQRPLHIEFIKGGSVPDYAKATALERLSFPGLPHHADPLDYLLWFDTEIAKDEQGWSADELAAVEEKLLHGSGAGIDWMVVEPVKAKPPYPRYVDHRKTQGQRKLEHAIKDIVATYETAGFDIDDAIAFERENDNDPSVVAALEGLRPTVESEEQVIAA